MRSLERGIWRPYTQEAGALPPVPIESARGAFLFTQDGRRLLDGVSSWWVITHGHCEPVIVGAVRDQAARLDQVLFANFSHRAADDLAENLFPLVDSSLNRSFLSDNGSTSVEVALKMAIQGQMQRGQPRRTKFLAFSRAYHGDTVGAMSVSARGVFTKPFQKMLFDVILVDQPIRSDAPPEAWISSFRRILAENKDEIAGVILEPVLQGAAGMVLWPKEAVREIALLAKQAGAYLLFDEVFTGFGRTGTMFAYEQIGCVPDLLCLSKGLTGGTLPLGATLATEEVFRAFRAKEKAKMFFHGHSFTGNPLACAAAAANLSLCREPEFLQNVRRISEIHRTRLAELATQEPIVDPRAIGPLVAFELPGRRDGYISYQSEEITARALERGLFLRPLGDTVYFLPPYCCDNRQLQESWDVITEIVRGLDKSAGGSLRHACLI